MQAKREEDNRASATKLFTVVINFVLKLFQVKRGAYHNSGPQGAPFLEESLYFVDKY